MILQDIFEFNQPNLEGGLDLSIHEEDIWPVRIHVQNLVVVPDIEMLFKWLVVYNQNVLPQKHSIATLQNNVTF